MMVVLCKIVIIYYIGYNVHRLKMKRESAIMVNSAPEITTLSHIHVRLRLARK